MFYFKQAQPVWEIMQTQSIIQFKNIDEFQY